MAGDRSNVRYVLLAALCAALAGCAAAESTGAQRTADAATKAVYADDYDALTATFDPSLKPQVTRTEVGVLSDKLHALGNYTGLTYVDGDPIKSEYTYRAAFDKGTVSIVVRVDPRGELTAYRLFPQS